MYFILTVSLLLATGFATEPWGVDASLAQGHKQEQQPTSKRTATDLILFYQKFISPSNGPRSSYYPSSSQYAYDAICKYGLLKGICMGCDRLMRENHNVWYYPVVDAYGGQRKLDPVR